MAHEPGVVLKQLVKLPKNPASCWEWVGHVNPQGLPTKQVNGKPMAAKRWMWSQLFGDPPPGLEVFGTCGTLTCINPYHLSCGLPHDRVQRGSLTNLTPGDVRRIKRAKRAGPYEKAALALEFDVDIKVLQAIWRGDQWKQVTKL